MKFVTKNSAHSTALTGYKEKYRKRQWIQSFLVYKLITT
jgi:hypothetical protein